MPRNFADVVRRVSRGYGIPVAQAAALLGRPVFTIRIDDLSDEEATDVFAFRPSYGTAQRTAVASQFSHVQLFNPLGSGVIGIIDNILIDSPTAMTVQIGNSDTRLGTAATGALAFRDRRITGNPALENRIDSNVALQLTALWRVLLGASVPLPLRIGSIILEPGTGLGIEAQTVNAALTANFQWREESI